MHINVPLTETGPQYVEVPRLDTGELIEVGKAYEAKADRKAWKVLGFRRGHHPVVAIDSFGNVRELEARWLREIDRDTQEKIDADAAKGPEEYWGCRGIHACKICPSIVDGKNPRERYGVKLCAIAYRLDLLRRQRKLDGKE